MTGVLFRTGSGPLHSSLFPSSPKITIPLHHDSFYAFLNNSRQRITRAISEPKEITRFRSISVGSRTYSEFEEESLSDDIGQFKFAEKCFDRTSWIPATEITVEESQFPDISNGSGHGFGSGRSNDNGNYNHHNKIGANYKNKLKSNPNDPLLLRNYGKFLHEVEGNVIKAEEYYGRAILASPGDGELLSLYGKLIWDTQRDRVRAQSYFDQAVNASPDDCMVMGSYAQFMWEVEEDEDQTKIAIPATQPMLAAF